MPRGPGIDQGDALLAELVAEEKLTERSEQIGPYEAIQYVALDDSIPGGLSLEAIEAIRDAVGFVKPKTATELSDLTHEFSRSWNAAENGAELNIYSDLSPRAVYESRRDDLQRVASTFDEVWEDR